jgi:creatinine amidohydrolase
MDNADFVACRLSGRNKGTNIMLLHHMTWKDVEAYLAANKGIIVPIGSTEQHGPNGPIGTDVICPEQLAVEVGELDNILIAPSIAFGMAQHHLAFPGTMSLKPATLLLVLKDLIASLAGNGFERIYFLNGHGGNIATVTAAFSEVYAECGAASPKLKLQSWFMGPRFRKLSRELYGVSEGSHATPSEVSLAWRAWPDAVKDVPMTPKIAPKGVIRGAEDYRRQFPDGRIGSDPSLSSVVHGKRIFAAAVEDIREHYAAFALES